MIWYDMACHGNWVLVDDNLFNNLFDYLYVFYVYTCICYSYYRVWTLIVLLSLNCHEPELLTLVNTRLPHKDEIK